MTDREEDRELSDLRKLQDSDLSDRREGADRQTSRDRDQADRDISAQRGRVDRRLASLRIGRGGRPPRLNSLRTVLLLHPFQTPIVFCLFVVGAVFQFSKDTLDHTAVSFEARGILHHVLFHHPLWIGAGLTLIGLFVAWRGAVICELVGIVGIMTALSVNVIALVAEGDDISGLTLAIRVGLLLGFAVRVYILLTQPKVIVKAGKDAR